MLTHTHSKSKHAIIFICGFLLGCGIVLNTIIFCCLNVPKIEPGQIWKYKGLETNPFQKPNCNIREVIDIEKNYVLFVNQRKDTLSMQIKNFKHNSVLISEKK